MVSLTVKYPFLDGSPKISARMSNQENLFNTLKYRGTSMGIKNFTDMDHFHSISNSMLYAKILMAKFRVKRKNPHYSDFPFQECFLNLSIFSKKMGVEHHHAIVNTAYTVDTVCTVDTSALLTLFTLFTLFILFKLLYTA